MDMQNLAQRIRCLSVYRGVLRQRFFALFLELGGPHSRPAEEIYSEMFFELVREERENSFARMVSDAVCYDDNPFSRLCAAGKTDKISRPLRQAAKADIDALRELAFLSPDSLAAFFHPPANGLPAFLPRFETGEIPAVLEGGADTAAAFYRAHGCGMFAKHRAFSFQNGKIEPIFHPDPIRLSALKGYEQQKEQIIRNTRAFLAGFAANNLLLYGDMGTGKSSTVHAVLNEFAPQGLRMIEISKEDIHDFPILIDRVANIPQKFIVFIDDLSFAQQDDSFAALKAILEGGLAARPGNLLIYATSNRRHLVRERFSDREGDEIHFADTMQELLSLSDRFGISITFLKPGREEFCRIVTQLAEDRKLDTDRRILIEGAERWALERGGRSPRIARQYIDYLSAKLSRRQAD